MTRAKTNQRQIVINRNRSRRFRYSRKNSKAQEEGEDDVFNMSFHENRGSKSVLELLRAWVNCYAIPVRAVNTLLKILIIAGLSFSIFHRWNFCSFSRILLTDLK